MSDIKVCPWLDLYREPLVLEATALPTEPQPLPKREKFVPSEIEIEWEREIMKDGQKMREYLMGREWVDRRQSMMMTISFILNKQDWWLKLGGIYVEKGIL